MPKMAAELVNSATSENLAEVDWTKNIEICELVASDQRQAKDVIKAIKKRLGSKNTNTQLYAVMLLEMLMNNIGEHIHKQVIDNGILLILVKIVKKKSDLPVRERIFLLLDATQTSLCGASGKFPQYYTAYYELVSAGVQFPQRHSTVLSSHPSSGTNKKNTLNGELASPRYKTVPLAQLLEPQTAPESSIIQKASNALDVLKEVLDSVDTQNSKGTNDDFTLDLVEQCSFQKQRVMHLVLTCRDEKVVSRAIDLNEQLQNVLARHDALLSGRFPITANHVNHQDAYPSTRPASTANHVDYEEEEEEEEEEAEQLFQRMQRGKACARLEDEEEQSAKQPPFGFLGLSIPAGRLNGPLIRPVHTEPPHEINAHPLPVAIPPPPAKRMEREKFFQDKMVNGSSSADHMRGLSLHSRNASSSGSGSIDFSD